MKDYKGIIEAGNKQIILYTDNTYKIRKIPKNQKAKTSMILDLWVDEHFYYKILLGGKK